MNRTFRENAGALPCSLTEPGIDRQADLHKHLSRVKSQAKSLISLREARSGLKIGLVAR